MEVEVKIRLPSADAHSRVREMFSKECTKNLGVYEQENTFFDGVNGELRTEKAAFRIRRQQEQSGKVRYFVTLKAKSKLRDGIHRAAEEEEEVDQSIAEKILADPASIGNFLTSTRVLKLIGDGFRCENGWVKLGNFQTKREKFLWKDYTIELDQTTYPFGVAYEIELETEKPEEAKKLLESLLQTHGIQYSYSKHGKFANMLNQRID